MEIILEAVFDQFDSFAKFDEESVCQETTCPVRAQDTQTGQTSEEPGSRRALPLLVDGVHRGHRGRGLDRVVGVGCVVDVRRLRVRL